MCVQCPLRKWVASIEFQKLSNRKTCQKNIRLKITHIHHCDASKLLFAIDSRWSDIESRELRLDVSSTQKTNIEKNVTCLINIRTTKHEFDHNFFLSKNVIYFSIGKSHHMFQIVGLQSNECIGQKQHQSWKHNIITFFKYYDFQTQN